jgi:hypothetical protein
VSALASLQRQVASAIRHRDDPLDALVRETPGVDRATRLGVYQQAYILRLDEALRANYPKLHLLLGDDDFFALTGEYLAVHPSRRASIRWFGDALAPFLGTAPHYAAVPALAELARFEWALGSTFDAADAPALPIDVLTTLDDDDWPILRPRFQPAFSILDLQWNAPAIWRALGEQDSPPPPEAAPRYWAVWRQALQPHFCSLDPDDAALVGALKAGQPFGEACESLLAWHDETNAPARAAGLLGQWLGRGWISALM